MLVCRVHSGTTYVHQTPPTPDSELREEGTRRQRHQIILGVKIALNSACCIRALFDKVGHPPGGLTIPLRWSGPLTGPLIMTTRASHYDGLDFSHRASLPALFFSAARILDDEQCSDGQWENNTRLLGRRALRFPYTHTSPLRASVHFTHSCCC